VWGIRSATVAIILLLATAPFLPWELFVQDLGQIVTTLSAQSHGGLSSFGTWPLAIVAVVALLVLDPRDAAFLFVPALWPDTQFHYSAIALALAVRSPIVAIGLAVPWAHAATAVAVCEAVRAVWRRRTAGLTGPSILIGVLADSRWRHFAGRHHEPEEAHAPPADRNAG
jgi:hypothetical protein